MADRLTGKQLVPAPAIPAWPTTLISVLEANGLLHDAPEGSHLQNGVYWESDFAAGVGGNDDVAYEEGSFASEDKTIQHDIAYTGDGFAFELTRMITLGVGSGGTEDEQRARAIRRFETWESFDLEARVKEWLLDGSNSDDITGDFEPEQAVARLFAAISPIYGGAPMILSGRGASVELQKHNVVEKAGAIYVPGSGFGVLETVAGEIFGVGTISVWRTPAVVVSFATSAVNEVTAFVERSYYVVIDGPKFHVTSTFATA